MLELIEKEEGQFTLSCKFRNIDSSKVWIFIGVYGLVKSKERHLLWKELAAIRGLWEEPWCIGAIIIQLDTQQRGIKWEE